jgi:hypothetical protein
MLQLRSPFEQYHDGKVTQIDPECTVIIHALVIRATTATGVDWRNNNVSVEEEKMEASKTVYA